MVRGLPIFRERFAGLEDKYVIIGGAAIDVAMQAADIEFRATKDLDIVLHVNALDDEFARTFWEFVEEGGYTFRQKSTGKPTFYRFHDPANKTFPHMMELFSAAPNLTEPPEGQHLTRLPLSEEVSSLSAILLNDGYYDFLRAGIRVQEGLSVLAPSYLVPLKARAWLDLSARREAGEPVATVDIKKHRNDIIRLTQLISPADRVALGTDIRRDLTSFVLRALPGGAEPAAFGVAGMSLGDVQMLLTTVYSLVMPDP